MSLHPSNDQSAPAESLNNFGCGCAYGTIPNKKYKPLIYDFFG